MPHDLSILSEVEGSLVCLIPSHLGSAWPSVDWVRTV